MPAAQIRIRAKEYIEEAGMAFRLYSKMFLHVYLSRYRYQRREDFRLFYYVAVPLADDALEEDPNLYKGPILNSFSNGFEFVDLGNFKPGAGPPV